ncbi:hypothetical protein MA16_Dca013207 [Dendrobium catenatum]|uniref:Uncharacterized protein n=1 Tax=Dendrobium catenatum TaxID=906689 RepID=A0A2I0WNC3_9ASPA|nr:hypothetical protein MA16_Dca013207 [Dendrobium catenatum]
MKAMVQFASLSNASNVSSENYKKHICRNHMDPYSFSLVTLHRVSKRETSNPERWMVSASN